MTAEEGARVAPGPSETERALEWIRFGNTGTSSKQIWKVLTGLPLYDEDPRSYGSLPRDPDDFGRCHMLLKKIPEWRARLPEVARCYPSWGPLVREWDALSALYERDSVREDRNCFPLFERMQELAVEAGVQTYPVFRQADADARRAAMASKRRRAR